MPINDLAKRRSILIVEDEYFIADDMARALADQGAEIIGPVGSVEEALELLKQHDNLSGALLDLNLHGRLSYDVADVLMTRGVPFIFSTGYDTPTLPVRFASIPCFVKPSDARDMARALLKMEPRLIALEPAKWY